LPQIKYFRVGQGGSKKDPKYRGGKTSSKRIGKLRSPVCKKSKISKSRGKGGRGSSKWIMLSQQKGNSLCLTVQPGRHRG